jgi:hypothetical protein
LNVAQISQKNGVKLTIARTITTACSAIDPIQPAVLDRTLGLGEMERAGFFACIWGALMGGNNCVIAGPRGTIL